MQKPMIITHNGVTLELKEWAQMSGVKHVTLYSRIKKGVPFERAIDPRSLKEANGYWYKKVAGDAPGSAKYEHRAIAERAIGKPLPKMARVHHVDGNPLNNTRTNLVVCPNDAYHKLLHARTDALNACGNANYRKCTHCKRWDDPRSLKIYGQQAVHRECHNRYFRERREAERQSANEFLGIQ